MSQVTRYSLVVIVAIAVTGCGNKMEDPPEGASGDPRALAAKRVGESIKQQRESNEKNASVITDAVRLTREVDRITEKKKVAELSAAYERAIAAAHALDEGLGTLDRELRHATNAYSAAAQGFADRAEDYTDAKLKGVCLQWADHYRAQGLTLPYHREQVATLRKELQPTLVLLRQSKQLVDDYGLFLSTYHTPPVPQSEAAPYLSAMKEYVGKFSTFEAALGNYREGK